MSDIKICGREMPSSKELLYFIEEEPWEAKNN